MCTDRHSIPATAYKFVSDQFAMLCVSDGKTLTRTDRDNFAKYRAAGVRLARNKLLKNGMSRLGDVNQAAEEAIAELTLCLCEAELKSRADRPVASLEVAGLIERLNSLLMQPPGHLVADPQLPVASTSHVLVALREFNSRLVTLPGPAFDASAGHVTPAQQTHTIQRSHKRVANYTIATLRNLCISQIRDHAKSEQYETDGGGSPMLHGVSSHDGPIDTYAGAYWMTPRNRIGEAVISPTFRAVVITSCQDALERLEANPPKTDADARLRPYIQAIVNALRLLLDHPNMNVYAQARLCLEAQGGSRGDNHNGLAKAFKHNIVVQLYRRIEVGLRWH